MAGNAHGDISEFYPDAISAECKGQTYGVIVVRSDVNGEYQASGECPHCTREKLATAILRFTPPRFRTPVSIPAAVADWASRGDAAQGLYLTGHVGTGKTHTAWSALAAWCKAAGLVPRVRPSESTWGTSRPNVIFTRMTDLLDDLRPGDESRQRIRDCQRAALLVIDDLGAEKASEWTQERFYSIVDERYASCLPLIVTSNLPPSKLADQVGERAASRLAEMCEVVPMTGTDRRRPAA